MYRALVTTGKATNGKYTVRFDHSADWTLIVADAIAGVDVARATGHDWASMMDAAKQIAGKRGKWTAV